MPGGATGGADEATALVDARAPLDVVGGDAGAAEALAALTAWVAEGGTAGSTEGALGDEQALPTRPNAPASTRTKSA